MPMVIVFVKLKVLHLKVDYCLLVDMHGILCDLANRVVAPEKNGVIWNNEVGCEMIILQ
jgi:hypothetical protein